MRIKENLYEKKEKMPKRRKRILIVLCAILFFVCSVLGVLQMGSVYTEKTWEFWSPDYEKIEISDLLQKQTLSDSEYELVYRQTGLTKLAVDDMRITQEGRKKILRIQEVFFTDFKVQKRLFALFTYMDEIDGWTQLCDLQDGDIIVSATTRVSWWRYGHASIVVDGERNIIAESIGPGAKSETANANVFNILANFLVLRPKADPQLKTQIANFVQTEMIGLPYRFTTGILSKKYKENIKYSQCAHFVWYAYKKYGIDLDSNGGGLVKPQDIAKSDKVEVVQAYGFDLDKLWN